ncbi:MAG: Cupin [Frankiaceae bacterium]|nr:Cupin [Frankiaceae bacterium]
MIPDESSAAPATGSGRAALLSTAAQSSLGADSGIEFWRGFDPAAVGTPVFLARALAAAGTRIPPHWHSEDTVAYLVSGHAAFRSGESLEQTHELAAGDWLFVPAGMVHVEETPSDVHGEFLYARAGGGGTTTYVEDVRPDA